MPNWNQLEQRLMGHLGLDRPPVAVTFRDTVPGDVRKFEARRPCIHLPRSATL